MIASTSLEEAFENKMRFVESLRKRPIAVDTTKANEQHYEVGTGLLKGTLGPRMKYSSCLYPKGSETLGQAEVEMLSSYVKYICLFQCTEAQLLTCTFRKAGIKDGMNILDLG